MGNDEVQKRKGELGDRAVSARAPAAQRLWTNRNGAENPHPHETEARFFLSFHEVEG
jgi:hypothetical protein